MADDSVELVIAEVSAEAEDSESSEATETSAETDGVGKFEMAFAKAFDASIAAFFSNFRSSFLTSSFVI